jgi:DedD protein
MDFAFWRRNKRLPVVAKVPAARSSTAVDEDGVRSQDPASQLRGRARRRFIGAAALLLAVAIVVPMLLDPEPRPVADNIAIDMPSESVPFTPRLSLPPAPSDNAPDLPAVGAPTAPAVPATVSPPPQSKSQPKVDEKKRAAEPRKSPATDKAEEQRARALLDGKPANGAAKMTVAQSGSFAVQAAATANEAAARDLAERLRKAGFEPYVEKTETKDGTRHRVRVGPYPSRDEAERSRLKLKSLGIGGQLVAL